MSKTQVVTIGTSLISHLSKVSDPRIDRGKHHRLIDVLVTTVAAVLSGANNWVEIADWGKENKGWLSTFLELPNGIASHDTFGRIFSIISPDEFQKAFRDWVNIVRAQSKNEKEIIAIDGKFLKGALKEAGRHRSAIIMVNAWSTGAGLSLAQLTCRLKKDEGEKKVMEEMIDCLDVKDAIITLDANGTTTTIFNKIVNKGGDAVIGLKDNQRSLLKIANHIFDYKENDKLKEKMITTEKDHGRLESRTYEIISFEKANTCGMEKSKKIQLQKWTNLKGIGRVVSEREIILTGQVSIETRYFILSFDSDVSEFAKAVREHWGIENKLHWQLDVTFREDHSRARVGHSAENLAVVRQMGLNMLKLETTEKRSIRRKRLLCGWNKKYLIKVLLGEI